jgi:hypothetical protein
MFNSASLLLSGLCRCPATDETCGGASMHGPLRAASSFSCLHLVWLLRYPCSFPCSSGILLQWLTPHRRSRKNYLRYVGTLMRAGCTRRKQTWFNSASPKAVEFEKTQPSIMECSTTQSSAPILLASCTKGDLAKPPIDLKLSRPWKENWESRRNLISK